MINILHLKHIKLTIGEWWVKCLIRYVSYEYEVDQAQENKTLKEKCDTIVELDNVLQINY